MEKINKKNYKQLNFLCPKKTARSLYVYARADDKLFKDFMTDLVENYVRERSGQSNIKKPDVEEIKQSPESWA